MAQFYNFAGQRIIQPGSYTERSFPVDQGVGYAGGNAIIIGEVLTASGGGVPYNAAIGGQPALSSIDNILNVIPNQATALGVFGGGPLYYGAEFFLTPTKDNRFKTPSEAKCIVVNPMTQASAQLLNSAAPIIDVTYNTYGMPGNQAAVQVAAGSVSGKLVTLLYQGQKVVQQDNLALPLISLQYTGAGSAAALTIAGNTMSVVVTGGGAESFSINLANYSSLGALISYLNGLTSYACVLLGASDEYTTIFDAVASQDIKTAYACQATVEAIIRVINSSGTFTAVLHTAAARLVPDNTATFTYLTGGTVSAAQTSDWTAILTMLESYDVDDLVIMTSSIAIQGLVTAHCESMNSITHGKYRQWGAGASGITGSTGSKATQIAQMKAINSAYGEYCISPFQRWDYVSNVLASFDPYYLYPMIAGLRYANNVGMDVVFKYVNVLSTPDIAFQDKNDYAAAGATYIQKSVSVLNGSTNFEIKCNNSTFQGSQVTRSNPAVVYEINVLTKDFEAQVIEKIRALDKVANTLVVSTIQNWITTYLFPKYRDTDGYITDYKDAITGVSQKAFDKVVFTQEGEVFKCSALLTMSVTPRFAFNFLTFITPGQLV